MFQKVLICISLAALSFGANAANLLEAWEIYQKENKEVLEFKKVDENLYKIKFQTIPYDGTLKVLAAEAEDINYQPDSSTFSKIGYVDIELPEMSQETIEKYSRKYYRWMDTNTLYYDESSNSWVESNEYYKTISKKEKKVSKPTV